MRVLKTVKASSLCLHVMFAFSVAVRPKVSDSFQAFRRDNSVLLTAWYTCQTLVGIQANLKMVESKDKDQTALETCCESRYQNSVRCLWTSYNEKVTFVHTMNTMHKTQCLCLWSGLIKPFRSEIKGHISMKTILRGTSSCLMRLESSSNHTGGEASLLHKERTTQTHTEGIKQQVKILQQSKNNRANPSHTHTRTALLLALIWLLQKMKTDVVLGKWTMSTSRWWWVYVSVSFFLFVFKTLRSFTS